MHIESRLTFKQLRAFEAVYRRGKLSAAADELGVTQSAISVLIRQIEDALNTRLFDRTTRSLVPTRAADDAYGVVERILQDVGTLGSNFRDLAEGSRGRVRLVATPATAVTILPGAARRFARKYANIEFVLDDCAPDQFLPNILNERADMGIGAPPPDGVDFVSEPLLADPLMIVCAEDHRFADQDSVRWAELDGAPLIAFRFGYGIRQLIDQNLARANARPVVAHEVGFLDTAVWMAGSGLGVAILPSALAHLHMHKKNVAVRPLVEPEVTRMLALVTKRGRSLSPACRLFIDIVVEEIERMRV